MKIIENAKYSQDHEWVVVDGGVATVGITDYAQDALGDLVFIELPEVDADYSAGDTLATVESVKAASDVLIPVSGKVTEVNSGLEDTPEAINADAFGSWIAKLELSDESELDGLMDAAAYAAFCEGEH